MYMYTWTLPTSAFVKLIPLEITDETHDLYYAEVSYLLMRHYLLNSLNNYWLTYVSFPLVM